MFVHRFPEIKALRLEKKSREDGDETEGKKRRGKVGGLKSKLFGGSKYTLFLFLFYD